MRANINHQKYDQLDPSKKVVVHAFLDVLSASKVTDPDEAIDLSELARGADETAHELVEAFDFLSDFWSEP